MNCSWLDPNSGFDLWQLEWSVHHDRDPRRLPGIRAFLAADSSWKIWWSKMSDVTLINIPRVHQNENYIFPNIILCPSYPSDHIKYSLLTASTQLAGSFLIGTTFRPDFSAPHPWDTESGDRHLMRGAAMSSVHLTAANEEIITNTNSSSYSLGHCQFRNFVFK